MGRLRFTEASKIIVEYSGSMHLLIMRSLLFYVLISIQTYSFCYAQRIEYNLDSVQVNSLYSGYPDPLFLRATYHSNLKLNGLVLVEMQTNGKRIPRFHAVVKDNQIVGTAVWYNRKGDTLCTLDCKVHPSNTSFLNSKTYSEITIPVFLRAYRNGDYRIYGDVDQKNRVIYSCQYADDKKNGIEKNYYRFGSLLTTKEFVNDRANGKFVYYYDNGMVFSTGNYVQDVKRGTWIDYHKNGKLYRMHSDYNGPLDTMFRWDQNGRVMESGFYSNGEPTGTYKLFHENGQQQIALNYVNGKRQGLKREWYDNGLHFDSCYFKNDVRHGATYMWWSDGKLRKKAFYVDGIEDGAYELHEENGSLLEKGKYNKGKRIGTWKIQNEDGKLIEVNYDKIPYEEELPMVELQEELVQQMPVDYVTELPEGREWVYKLNSLFSIKQKSVIRKYNSIRIRAEINSAGQCEFQILTSMKKKDHKLLAEKLKECTYQWRSLILQGKAVATVVYFSLYLYG